jgi:hypothetical protein
MRHVESEPSANSSTLPVKQGHTMYVRTLLQLSSFKSSIGFMKNLQHVFAFFLSTPGLAIILDK